MNYNETGAEDTEERQRFERELAGEGVTYYEGGWWRMRMRMRMTMRRRRRRMRRREVGFF